MLKTQSLFGLWFCTGRGKTNKHISDVSIIRSKDFCEWIVYEVVSVNMLHCINSLIAIMYDFYKGVDYDTKLGNPN